MTLRFGLNLPAGPTMGGVSKSHGTTSTSPCRNWRATSRACG